MIVSSWGVGGFGGGLTNQTRELSRTIFRESYIIKLRSRMLPVRLAGLHGFLLFAIVLPGFRLGGPFVFIELLLQMSAGILACFRGSFEEPRCDAGESSYR